MFSSSRVQVLDLGSHTVKSLIASVSRGGKLSIDAMRSDRIAPSAPTAEAYATALAPILTDLAASFFRRQLPIHLIPSVTFVRGTLHHLPPVDEEQVPGILRTSRSHFVGSFGSRVPIYDRSFALNVARDEEKARVTAVHAYARRADIVFLRTALETAGLRWGAILPPALALSELALAVPGANLDPAPRVILDMGAVSTTVLVLDDGGVVGCRRVFGGTEDAFRKLAQDFPDATPEVLAGVRDAFLTKGREGLEQAAADADLPVDAATVIAERFATARDRLLTAIFHAACDLARPSTAADDEDEEAAPELSLPGPVGVVGGGASMETLLEAFQARFEVPCFALDAFAVLGIAPPAKVPDSPAAYGCALGALAVFNRMADQANLADEAGLPGPAVPEDEGPGVAWAIRPMIAGAVLLVIAAGAFVFAGQNMEANLTELQKALDEEKAALPQSDEVRKMLLAFRDNRAREVAIDARFAYVAELMRDKVGWVKLCQSLDRLVAKGECIITGIDVRVQWPNAGEGARGNRNRQRVASLTLRGEAFALPAITAVVQALRAGLMPDAKNKQTRLPGSSKPDPTRPGFQFEISGDLDATAVDR